MTIISQQQSSNYENFLSKINPDGTLPGENQAPANQESIYPAIATIYENSTPLSQEEPSPLTGAATNTFPSNVNAPEIDPITFRHPSQREAQYQIQALPQESEFDNAEVNFIKRAFLEYLPGFNPLNIDTSHPIHNQLYQLGQKLIAKYKDLPIQQKIFRFENAVTELLHGVVGIHGYAMPQYESLEIGIRQHFFLGLLDEEKAKIDAFFQQHRKFPNDLCIRENILTDFASKNGFYYFPNLFIAPALLKPEIMNACISKASLELPLEQALPSFEDLIQREKTSLNLDSNSQCSWFFEQQIRETLAASARTKLAMPHKAKFQTTGEINRDQLLNDIDQFQDKLPDFQTKQGEIGFRTPFKFQLLSEIFDLTNENAPFDHLRVRTAEAQQEASTKLASPPSQSIWRIFDFSKATREKEAAREKEKQSFNVFWKNKFETIDWAEGVWGNYYPALPLPQPTEQPTAPPSLDEISLDEEDFTIIASTDSAAQGNSAILNPPQTTLSPAPTVVTPSFKVRPVIQVDNTQPVSYVDIVFADLLNKDDAEVWNQLPAVNQRDVLRHVYYMPRLKGKAEDVAMRIFKDRYTEMHSDLNKLNQTVRGKTARNLDPEFKTKAEELLNFFYSIKIKDYPLFLQKLRALPVSKEPNFLKYFYESAKQSNVPIEKWDHRWAEYHWHESNYLLISMQALERCLHTP